MKQFVSILMLKCSKKNVYYLPSFVINDIFLVVVILRFILFVLFLESFEGRHTPLRKIAKRIFYCILFYCFNVHTRIK
jgi:hypothetical protein